MACLLEYSYAGSFVLSMILPWLLVCVVVCVRWPIAQFLGRRKKKEMGVVGSATPHLPPHQDHLVVHSTRRSSAHPVVLHSITPSMPWLLRHETLKIGVQVCIAVFFLIILVSQLTDIENEFADNRLLSRN